jgi:hypothetical protein
LALERPKFKIGKAIGSVMKIKNGQSKTRSSKPIQRKDKAIGSMVKI